MLTNESLLQYIWQFQLFSKENLQTATGQSLQIIHQGKLNTDSGPDFSTATIQIGALKLVGNVEIHIHEKDFYLHNHKADKAFQSVILHVVLESNATETVLENGNKIPILILKNRINEQLVSRFYMLQKQPKGIACEAFLTQKFVLPFGFFERLMIERLEQKVSVIQSLLDQFLNDWEQVCFIWLARYLGGSVNKEAFENLAKSIPLHKLLKQGNNSFILEAILFGQAGLLEADFVDEFPQKLKKEYQYQKRLLDLKPLANNPFKFLRMRPASFPSIRISQLADLLSKGQDIFKNILLISTKTEFYEWLDLKANSYWETNSKFDQEALKINTHLGESHKDVLLINALVPLIFSFGKYRGEEALCEKAIAFLNTIPCEKNSITNYFSAHHFDLKTALDSQAVVQLKTNYCDKKNCFSCSLGHKFLTSK